MMFTKLDCNLIYWEEKFIACLTKQFAINVRNNLRKEFNVSIPLIELAYDQLINIINQEGLALYTALKLKEMIKNENRINKKELGIFLSTIQL